MTDGYIPAHVAGRNFATLRDVKETLDQKGILIGGYGRISTKSELQLTSIEYQEKLLREWAELNSFKMVDYYVDMMSGGYSYNRNDINRMLGDIKTGRIQGIITKEISRTSRDVKDMLELKRRVAAYGGFLISIKEGYDSRVDEDEFFLIMYSALAQKERKTTASRVKITQMIKAKEGKTNVTQPAYGYRLSDDKQHIEKNPETYPVFRLIVEKFMSGWGQLKIAKHLNALGIPSKRGQKWCTNAIKTILSNPVYLGVTIYNSTTLVREVDGTKKRVVRPREEWVVRDQTHEPLLTGKEWETIQNIMHERKRKDVKDWTCDRKYLGSSILRCAECGGKIYGARQPRKKRGQKVEGDYLYRYYCSGVKGRCTPPVKRWKMEKMDQIIMDLFRGIFDDRQKLLKTVQEEFDEEDLRPGMDDNRQELRAAIGTIDKAVKKQQLAFETDAITLEEFRNRMEELRGEKQGLMERLAEVNLRLSQQESYAGRTESIFSRIKGKLEKSNEMTLEEKIYFVSLVFEAIYIKRDYSVEDVKFNLS